MKQIIVTFLCCLAIVSGAFAQQAGRDRVFKVDVVALIDHGKEVLGKVELSLQHERYLYQFSTPANLDAFKADPARYRVQLGGACVRMGLLAFSGRGPSLTIGEIEQRFSGFHDVGGLLLPGRVDTLFGGKPVADKSGSFAVQTVNDPADRALFDRVTPTPTPTPTSTPAPGPKP